MFKRIHTLIKGVIISLIILFFRFTFSYCNRSLSFIPKMMLDPISITFLQGNGCIVIIREAKSAILNLPDIPHFKNGLPKANHWTGDRLLLTKERTIIYYQYLETLII